MAEIDYGSDLDCSDDLSPLFIELPGNDPRVVVQAIYRRLTTGHGRLLDDPDYGLDLRAMLHKGMTVAEQNAMGSRIRAEIEKDDRVYSASVAVQRYGDLYQIRIVLTLASGAPPFTMTLKVTSADVVLEAIGRT